MAAHTVVYGLGLALALDLDLDRDLVLAPMTEEDMMWALKEPGAGSCRSGHSQRAALRGGRRSSLVWRFGVEGGRSPQ